MNQDFKPGDYVTYQKGEGEVFFGKVLSKKEYDSIIYPHSKSFGVEYYQEDVLFVTNSIKTKAIEDRETLAVIKEASNTEIIPMIIRTMNAYPKQEPDLKKILRFFQSEFSKKQSLESKLS